jgi:cytochrome c556
MKGLRIVLAGCLLAFFGTAIASEDPSADHVKVMKSIGKNFGEIRKGNDVKMNADAMMVSLKEVSAFWKLRNSDIAMASCKKNFEGAKAVSEAAAKDDKAGIAEGVKLMGAGCKGCHDQHREKISDTEYKIK